MGIKCTGTNVVSLSKSKLSFLKVCRTIGHRDLIQDKIWIQARVKKTKQKTFGFLFIHFKTVKLTREDNSSKINPLYTDVYSPELCAQTLFLLSLSAYVYIIPSILVLAMRGSELLWFITSQHMEFLGGIESGSREGRNNASDVSRDMQGAVVP